MNRRQMLTAAAAAGTMPLLSAAASAPPDPEVRLVKYRFRTGMRDRWIGWMTGAARKRRAEIMETLRHEGTITEAGFLSEDGKYLYLFMEAPSIDGAEAAYARSTIPIDAEYRRIGTASLEKVAELRTLCSFHNG